MKESTAIFGGGLAGLAAGYATMKAGHRPLLIEADTTVGGLSKTIVSGDFRYDIGGHRFFTRHRHMDELVASILGEELITVNRTSKIFMRGKFIDYPLRPANAILNLGPATMARVLWDYVSEKARRIVSPRQDVSLEDWVVGKFGRTLFEIYFKVYSEKVWGIPCSRISMSWMEKRVSGLSLAAAVKNAFFRFTGRDIPTLTDTFTYPALGIGRLSDRLAEDISKNGQVLTNCPVTSIRHDGAQVLEATIARGGRQEEVRAPYYISTIPLNTLVRLMQPAPPAEVVRAAESIGFRDLMLVALKVDRPVVTHESWIYIPEKSFAFGRMHEPKMWSPAMAPQDKTLVVVEFFCFRRDPVWSKPDEELVRMATDGLASLGFLKPSEVIGADVLRVVNAYPLFEVGYDEHCGVIYDYLSRLKNLSIAGRSGRFMYQNMDHAMISGMEAAGEASAYMDSMGA